MTQALWIAAGSALGGLLRFGVSRWLHGLAPSGVHLATLTVNLLGSLVFCWLMARQAHAPIVLPLYLGLTVGVLGGFTTYSTFNAELVRHLLAGHPDRALVYFAVTASTCLAGGLAGWWLGQARG